MLPSAVAETLRHERRPRSQSSGSLDDFLLSAKDDVPVVGHALSAPLIQGGEREPPLPFKATALAAHSEPNILARLRGSASLGAAGASPGGAAVAEQLPAMSVTLIMAAVYSVTYGSLLFHARGLPGAPYAPDGVVVWLLANIVGQVGVALVSGLPCPIAGGTLEMLPIFHAMYSNVALVLAEAPPEAVMGTALATSFVATLGLGVLLVASARAGVATWLRAVPLVVLKGALFGVAIFLFQSTFEVTVPQQGAIMLEHWRQWAPAVAVGTAIFLVDELLHSNVAIPCIFVLLAACPALLHLAGAASFEDMRLAGWVFEAAGGGGAGAWYQRFAGSYAAALPHARWAVVLRQVPGMVGFWITHALITLMDLKATEIITGVETDLNTEIRAVGVCNVLSAACGAAFPIDMPCSSNVSASKLGGGRLTGLVAIAGQLALLFVAQGLVPCLPRALPGAASWWLGLLFAKETIVDILQQHAQKYDVAIVVFMAAMMLADGFITALLLGLLVAMGLFTLQYSGSPVVIRAAGDARYFRSNVHRTREQDDCISRHCQKIWVIHVDGHVMFGSSPHLVDEVRRALEGVGSESVLLNCRGVQGLDYSGALDLVALGRKAGQRGQRVVLTELADNVQETLRRAGVQLCRRGSGNPSGLAGLLFESHYHAALKLCEDALLEGQGLAALSSPCASLRSLGGLAPGADHEAEVNLLLRTTFGDFLAHHPSGSLQAALAELRSYFKVVEYAAGSKLWEEGAWPTFCAGIARGELESWQAPPHGGRPRLMEVVTRGSFTGYTALANQFPYLQTLVVAGPEACVAALLTAEAWNDLLANNAPLAVAVLRAFMQRGGYEIRDMSRLMTGACS